MFINKSKYFLIVISLALAFNFALPVLASNTGPINPWGGDGVRNDIQDITGLGERDPRNIAAQVINIALGFLGIIAVGLILYGGFKWMTAAGNEDSVADAKKIIIAGVIGLIIILSAFAIANFVLTQLIKATA